MTTAVSEQDKTGFDNLYKKDQYFKEQIIQKTNILETTSHYQNCWENNWFAIMNDKQGKILYMFCNHIFSIEFLKNYDKWHKKLEPY